MKIINLIIILISLLFITSKTFANCSGMYQDADGRWLNCAGGNIYGDSRYNLDADPRYNLDADPRYNLDADPRYNLDADPRYNLDADPRYSLDGDPRYQ